MQTARMIQQGYWHDPALPYLEWRSTEHSTITYKTHSHKTFSIGCVYQGETATYYKNTTHIIKAGELILIDAGAAHSCNPINHAPRSYHMLYLDYLWCLDRLSKQYQQNIPYFYTQMARLTDPALSVRYLRLIQTLQQQQWVQANGQLHELMDIIFDQYCTVSFKEQEEPVLSALIKRQLLSDLVDPPSLSELSQHFKLCEETIVRIFKKETGITPMSFLANARIEYAKTLIRQGHEIVDAAYLAGFSDQSHFHKLFVDRTAATPRQYQKINF